MTQDIVEHKLDWKHLTSFQVPQLRKELIAIARKGPRGLMLDMSSVESIDSASLGVIVLVARLLPPPSRVCFFRVSPQIRTMCEVLRVNCVIGLADSREEAVELIESYLTRKATTPQIPSRELITPFSL